MPRTSYWRKRMKLLQKLGAVALVSLGLLVVSPARAMENIPDSARINGFAVGCQAYSFKAFSAFEAIKLTHEAGGKVIELFPGQNVKPGDKTLLNHFASDEVLDEVKAELKKNDVLAVN